MRLTKKVGKQLPNINAKFFITKILYYLRLSGFNTKRTKDSVKNDILWYHFTQYKFAKSTLEYQNDDMDINPPQCISYGIFPSNSIKTVSLKL